MLSANSKKARFNIQNYICKHFHGKNYDLVCDRDDVLTICNFIYWRFLYESRGCKGSLQTIFEDWSQGLPEVLDTHYYDTRSAVVDIAFILELCDAEKAKYTEKKAQKLLTHLIYRELKEQYVL